MKYQIILESSEQLSDQEFKDWIQDVVDIHFNTNDFKLVDARSLEGIRKELYIIQKSEEINITTSNPSINSENNSKLIEHSYNEIKELFHMD